MGLVDWVIGKATYGENVMFVSVMISHRAVVCHSFNDNACYDMNEENGSAHNNTATLFSSESRQISPRVFTFSASEYERNCVSVLLFCDNIMRVCVCVCGVPGHICGRKRARRGCRPHKDVH